MRWLLMWMMTGAFVGAVIATLLAPTVLGTLLASTGAADAMCQCSELVSNTSALLIRTQLWGAGVGALVLPLLAWLGRRKWAKKPAPSAAGLEPKP